mmetsp:Transcript_18165/g.55656  ORF Transcript_18165/g.55656 Transcript_18165/m.55656 type:complete len:161 (+) Transcript_18165:13-495(+)
MAFLARRASFVVGGFGVAAAATLSSSDRAPRCHCQVPCGIFDDPLRMASLREDAATIRKAMVQIQALSEDLKSAQTLNQATRWVHTKETHCDNVIKTTADYLLAQRVKPELFASDKDYAEALIAHHKLLVAAMKAKQTVDTAAVDALLAAIDHLDPMYRK